MKSFFKSMLGDLLASKKFRVVLIGIMLTLLNAGLKKIGADPMSPETLYTILASLGAFVGSQALADFGKYKAADLPAAPPVINLSTAKK